MKKNLEAELMSLAHKVLQLKNRADIHELKAMAGVLYEKLSVLSYTEKHFEGSRPTIGKKEVEKSLNGNDNERYAPDGTSYNPEGITEPNTEKIKDIVAQMPPESEDVDRVLDNILPSEKPKKEGEKPSGHHRLAEGGAGQQNNDDFRSHGISYDDLPQFEPVAKSPDLKPREKTETQPKPQNQVANGENKVFRPTQNDRAEGKRLHQKLRKGISFGLNERVVFVKHLFGGNVSDYERVMSQLNTFGNFPEARDFIENTVKPDYDWKGEEKYEKQFLSAIKNRLD